jgi:hypothetical protein
MQFLGALAAAEERMRAVIRSEAKNLGSCKTKQLQGSFIVPRVAHTQKSMYAPPANCPTT